MMPAGSETWEKISRQNRRFVNTCVGIPHVHVSIDSTVHMQILMYGLLQGVKGGQSVLTQNNALGCYLNGLGCYLNALGCYLNGLGCYLNALGCYLNALGCYLNALGCHINALGCYLNALGCYLNALGCYLNALGCYLCTVVHCVMMQWLGCQSVNDFLIYEHN